MRNTRQKTYEIPVKDNMSEGESVWFVITEPTTKQRVDYENAKVSKGRPDEGKRLLAAIKYGSQIITGIKPGGLSIPANEHPGVQSGKVNLNDPAFVQDAIANKFIEKNGESYLVTITHDAASPYYYDQWRKEVEACSDLIAGVAYRVFDLSISLVAPNEAKDEAQD